MRSKFTTLRLSGFLALSALTACEYEWKDEPVVIPVAESGEEVVISEQQVKQIEKEKKQAPPSDVRPVLAPGKPYAGSSTMPEKAKRLEILNLAATNDVVITTNSPGNDINNVFDGADDTLLRSNEINPVDITLEFKTPQKIRAVRIRSTYSDFGVAVQVDNGDRLILDPVPEGDWALMVWPNGITPKKIFVQTLRKNRDNYVHLNEIEVLQ